MDTNKQAYLKTLEAILDETLPHGERGEHEALTAILEELRMSRELLEAATLIEIPPAQIWRITVNSVTEWRLSPTRIADINCDGVSGHPSALDAYREVKKHE